MRVLNLYAGPGGRAYDITVSLSCLVMMLREIENRWPGATHYREKAEEITRDMRLLSNSLDGEIRYAKELEEELL